MGSENHPNTPMTIGHEYVGKVVKIGNEVTKVGVGESELLLKDILPVVFAATAAERTKTYLRSHYRNRGKS